MTDLFETDTDLEATTTSLDLRRLQRHRRRTNRRVWTLVLSAAGLVVLAVGGSIAWNFVSSFQGESTEVADYEGAGQGVVQVVVNSGDTGVDIANTLFEAGVIASAQSFIAEASANTAAAGITPGYYFLQREMKAEYALRALLDPANRNEITLTIPEGKTLDYYYQAIANVTEFSAEDIQEVAESDPEALGLPEQADGNLEGWLFPATYRFNPDVEPADVISEMIRTTVLALDRNGVAADERQRVLTIASIIEREARLAEDRPLISGVIENRLAIDMRLEMDSTVKYLSPSEGVWTSTEERQIDSPYNTYLYTGLPPGPIAAAGESSIQAANDPASHDYLFFVTVNLDTGETMYAENYDQHVNNVAVLNAWYAENRSDSTEDEG